MELGICQCGCGKPTPLAERDNPKRGDVAGQPMHLLWGHKKPRPKKRGDHNTELECKTCKEIKPVSEFYWKSDKDYYDYNCKPCCVDIRRKYNQTGQSITYRKKTNLMVKYGLTLEEYDGMIAEQNNRCAICKEEFSNGKRACVDHNHGTGAVRALLCVTCNVLVGYSKERKDILFRVYEYLDEHN